MGKGFEETPHQRDLDGKQEHKKLSKLLVIREMHMKIALRYHNKPNRQTKKVALPRASEDAEHRERSYTASGHKKVHFGKLFSNFLES